MERIFAVDDDQMFLQLAAAAARLSGADFKGSANGDSLERTVRDWSPTLVVLDIVLPGRDGLELLRALAASDYSGRVVLVTGYQRRYLEMAATLARVRGLKVAALLQKPVSADQIALSLAA